MGMHSIIENHFNSQNLDRISEVEKCMKIFLAECLQDLYDECEHGDEEHRKWLKDKFDNFLERKLNET